MKSLFGLFALLVLSYSSLSLAQHDVLCWDGDCLKNGWTQTHLRTGQFTDFQCYREGCEISGWIVGGTENISYYTQCKPGGCFQEGWYEVDRGNQQLLNDVVCEFFDCLQNGWNIYGRQGNHQLRCIENDCKAKGWVSTNSSGQSQSIVCKNAACFQSGWTSLAPSAPSKKLILN